MSACKHTWDTEPEADVTYTPPEHYDTPIVIRHCVTLGCTALAITRSEITGPVTRVYEEARHDAAVAA
jgi:hypothetical protein